MKQGNLDTGTADTPGEHHVMMTESTRQKCQKLPNKQQQNQKLGERQTHTQNFKTSSSWELEGANAADTWISDF